VGENICKPFNQQVNIQNIKETKKYKNQVKYGQINWIDITQKDMEKMLRIKSLGKCKSSHSGLLLHPSQNVKEVEKGELKPFI
jgi:hypothetical protein